MSNRANQVRWSGIAAITGGVMYAVKAAVILAGGSQPPLLFEAAPLAFGISLWLLGEHLAGRLARAGRILALVIIAATVANVLEDILLDREIVPTVSSIIDFVTGFGPFVALVLIGWASRRLWSSSTSWQFGPLAVAGLYPLSILAMVPVAFFVDLGGATGERLIELPILLIGGGWIAFGWNLVSAPKSQPALLNL
jgi:hypothetical protein